MKKKKKIMSYVAGLAILIGIVFALLYNSQFTIKNQQGDIHEGLKAWIEEKGESNFELNIHEFTQIDKTSSYIVLFEASDNFVGYGHLKKGWNGKFKIIQAGWNDIPASYTDIKTNNGMYGILTGQNKDLNISHIIASTYDQEFSFTVSVSDELIFMKYKKLPKYLKQTFLSEIIYYDENDKDIFSLK